MSIGEIVIAKRFTQRIGGLHLTKSCKRGVGVICITLGALKDTDPPPKTEEIIELMGAIGLFRGEEIKSILGESGWKKFEKGYRAKLLPSPPERGEKG